MSKIQRYNGNVRAFASAQQSGERYIFGDTTTESDSLSDQLTTDYLRGWAVISASDEPPLEWFNAVAFTATQFIAYLHQSGIPEWDGEQEYHNGSQANFNGQIYTCLVDNHTSVTTPDTDPANWKKASAGEADNADKLDGQGGSFYRNASNLNAGTVPNERLPNATETSKGVSRQATPQEVEDRDNVDAYVPPDLIPLEYDISTLPQKSSISDADQFGISDSESGGEPKRVSYSTLKSDITTTRIELDENASAVNNGDAIEPFTGDTANLSIGSGELELTGTGSAVNMPVYFTGDETMIVYGSIRSDTTNEFCSVRINYESGSDVFLFFNYDIDTNSRTPGALSYRSRSRTGTIYSEGLLATGVNIISDYKFILNWYRQPDSGKTYRIEFFDANSDTLALLGTVTPSGGTSDTGSPIVSVGIGNDTSSYTGTTFIQHLQVSRPNFTALGDSITAGHNEYDPNPGFYAGVDDYSSSWQCHLRAKLAQNLPTLRNNFVANQGVGGQNSGELLARAGDGLNNNSPVFIFGGCNNDFNVPLSYGTRNDNIGQILDRARAAGSFVVHLAAIVPNTLSASYPHETKYYDEWNEKQSRQRSRDIFIDIMDSGIRAPGERYIDTSYAADKVHPNIAGYTLIGEYVADKLTPLIDLEDFV